MWTTRSYEPELLDGQDYTRQELYRNLRELFWVNRLLGGHMGSGNLLKQCLTTGFIPDTVVDIGCGGGDSLEILQKKFAARLPQTAWIGTDLNPICLEYAAFHHPGSGIQYLQSDFRDVRLTGKTIFHAALFFHHFGEEEISTFIRQINLQGHALIINDLERNFLAWLGIRLIAACPGISRLFRHDAPLSVRRGFTTADWKQILANAGVQHHQIQRSFGFRHLICILPSQHGEN